jgi:hypothetical protein
MAFSAWELIPRRRVWATPPTLNSKFRIVYAVGCCPAFVLPAGGLPALPGAWRQRIIPIPHRILKGTNERKIGLETQPSEWQSRRENTHDHLPVVWNELPNFSIHLR